ncbi:ankyrin repeat protein [Armillaria luteobubalina]|uniref:Ankyrin repeat protein n=1 Tax=Armillaria luteobubalina TaxID=153913 RepID=A0AA39PZR6_9AGAR|nr:ankyrin repeat protein [Armillaria luteobubalina]
MSQTIEAQSFLERISSGISLDAVLKPSLDDETELRHLFATDKTNERLNNPYVGLVNVFDAPNTISITRAREVKSAEDLTAKYIMPLTEENRRLGGQLCMVPDMETFKKNWSIFTEGSLSQLSDWSNVVAAGGSVLACLTPLPESATVSKRATRKFYHSNAYPTSDVDLFLWGMTPEEAEVKIIKIYEAVRDSVPWDVTCIRTKHTVSIHFQIVLRLYTSPSEILTGFDIDAPCCAYDGEHVWANPRAIVAMMRQCNTVDMTRRSPSYEVRLAKYSSRAFEVYVTTLRREDIDPTIFERSIARIQGLARLLVLEKIKDGQTRDSFIQARRSLRGRPDSNRGYYRRKHKYKGDLKSTEAISGLEMNDYDVTSLHIPYGPGWDARRIDKLVYQTDLGMNSTFNPKNKGRRLHRHAAFFGTMNECLNDCCEHCPEPIDKDERSLREEEDKQYIRGRISFIEEDPGRQSMSGSFNPIDVGEWSEQVYIGPTDKVFTAIAAGDRKAVASLLTEEGMNVNCRDHVGRTTLHVAILCKTTDIACELIDAGARISARLVDGRSALHLAAQYDLLSVSQKLLERSAKNQTMVEEKHDDPSPPAERPSSEDDWTSEDDGVVSLDDEADGDDEDGVDNSDSDSDGAKDKGDEYKRDNRMQETADVFEDEQNIPDILDVNSPDWDLDFTPLDFAILFASEEMVITLLDAGADITMVSKAQYSGVPPLHSLTLTILRDDEDAACNIAERLLNVGAVSSIVNDGMRTAFYETVAAGRTKLVSTLLRLDPKATSVLNFPFIQWNQVEFPLSVVLSRKDYATLAVLLAHEAKLNFMEDDIFQVQLAFSHTTRRQVYNVADTLKKTVSPIEIALAGRDDILKFLITRSVQRYTQDKYSLLDWVRFAQSWTDKQIQAVDESNETPTLAGTQKTWCAFRDQLSADLKQVSAPHKRDKRDEERINYFDAKCYLADTESFLSSKGAKTWNEIFPDKPITNKDFDSDSVDSSVDKERYCQVSGISYRRDYIPAGLNASYDDLYEACFTGDNDKIQQLCLPHEGSEITNTLLSMSVYAVNPESKWSATGYTPLFAALMGRHWDTVQLVYSIIGAQYQPKEKTKKFRTKGIVIEDDDSDIDSDYSDDTVDQDEPTFFDVASRPSAIKSDTSQQLLLEETAEFPSSKDNITQSNAPRRLSLVAWAIATDDMEAFTQLIKLYRYVKDGPIDVYAKILTEIVKCDRPEMLDMCIRRSGHGISFVFIHGDEQEDFHHIVNDESRIYLGLNVHGKKRKDLARGSYPDTDSSEDDFTPLVWRAALAGATKVVQYLGSRRPLEAYKFYSISHHDEKAIKIRRTPDLENVLYEWLGWKTNALGESPLTAAVLSNKFETIKAMFDLKPKRLAKSVIHNRIKFAGSNLLMIALETRCGTDVVDLLLARGVDPVGADQIRGWNIFHIMAHKNLGNVVEYLLKKLSRDIIEMLLCQTSNERGSTPLHLAIKGGCKRIVKLFIDYTVANILQRDIDGIIPLHAAVKAGFPGIAKLIIDASPDEALHTENGVGETPLEIASLEHLTWKMKFHGIQCSSSSPELDNNVGMVPRWVPATLAEAVPKLRLAMTDLLQAGKLTPGTLLSDELDAFASLLDDKLEEASETTGKTEDDVNQVEGTDRRATFAVIAEAVMKRPGQRRLVHLLDVQKSVQRCLAKSKELEKFARSLREVDALEPMEDTERKERQDSLVVRTLGWDLELQHWEE